MQIATGDFNQDGKLDLAVDTGGGVSILLGNGDGTFKTHLDYPGGGFAIASGDFNGDGKLDLVTGGQNLVSILLGNGDGTFQAPINYQTNVLSGRTVFSIHVTDFNKDGKLDLAVNTETTEHVILLGNGDGTFQAPVEYLLANFISDSLTVGDFNGDGVPDWAAGDADGNTIGVMLSTAFKALSPSSLSFGSQDVGTISKAQTITISNPSNVNITIGSIASIGNFAETNNCGVDLKSGASCQLSITFSPSITGLQSGTINITDSTRVSPLAIPLSGIGVNEASLSFYPSRQNFSPQAVGSTSSAAAIVLENTGSAPLNLSAIGTTGVDSADFRQTNNCGGSLVPAGTCVVNVKFAPTAAGSRVASLSVSDTASGSPQIVALTGTGLGAAARFTPNTLAFLPQTVGTNSTAQAVLVTNTGNMPLSISSISISGDFAQTNSCNVTLSPGSNCQLSVVFTPTAVGNRAGIVTISDNALASPQLIAVSGTGAAAPDFTITSASGAPISQTISAGQSATFNLVVTPSGAFTGTVSLSCGISPVVNRAPTCGLSSSSLQLTGSSSQSLIVTVGSTGGALAGTVTAMSFPAGLMISAWVLLASAWLWFRNQRWRPEVASPLVVLAVLLWIGCGGSKSLSLSTPGTPSGTYTVTMMAASGNVNHAVTLTVVVR